MGTSASSRPSVAVRRATAGDADGILDCLQTAFEPYRQRYTPEGFKDTVLGPDTVHERLHSMSVFVAVTDAGAVVGTIGCQIISAEEGHLRGMAVLPEWQRRGVAEQLLSRAEQELRGNGCVRISLDTTRPLQRAIRFYEKHGFRSSGKVSDFFGMPLYEYIKELR